jgi:hypothetical protein
MFGDLRIHSGVIIAFWLVTRFVLRVKTWQALACKPS